MVDAYLSPILARYVAQVSEELDVARTGARLTFMMSSGGLTAAELFQGKDAILSGPAGGVVGMVETARSAGFARVIGFDMGGTSTDVAHFDGAYERAFETEVAGVRMRAPMMLIHTVAAGGGSILHYDGARLRVGPDSAGANPGPTCYRRGGPLTVTDANVMAGKLMPEFFPAIFGPRQDQPIDARCGSRRPSPGLPARSATARSPQEVADGFLQIAVANMAEAIKKISVQRGYDITGYALNCFGGAGGQHACLVADALGITRVLIHPLSGLLSAYGMGLADMRATRSGALELPLEASHAALRERGDRLAETCIEELRGQGVPLAASRCPCAGPYPLRRNRYRLSRFPPTRWPGAPPVTAGPSICGAPSRLRTGAGSASSTKARTLSSKPSRPRRSAAAPASPRSRPIRRVAAGPPRVARTTRFFSGGCWHDAEVFLRADLAAGHRLTGPAIVIEPNQTIVVEDGWAATLTPKDHLVLERVTALPQRVAVGTLADPVMLEIFNGRFMSIAEQMGVTLQNTAYSVNIKERLDFSCAVFDAQGTLVANAPHMPVHLGSMDKSVETVIRNNSAIHPGDVFALNAPYNGGTHLPDITVCTPVFDDDEAAILFWVASRGHHADVGGVAPGSMSPLATHIEEEGVYIDNFKIVDRGRFREEETRDLLTGARYPARNPLQNLNDLKAQIASNEKGVGGAEKHDRLFRARRRRSLYGPRAGQRRRERAPRPRPSRRFILRLRNGPGLPHPRARSQSTRHCARRPSISPAPRSNAPIISTRRRR